MSSRTRRTRDFIRERARERRAARARRAFWALVLALGLPALFIILTIIDALGASPFAR